MSVRKMCKGKTLKGKSCKNKCNKGIYCYCHGKGGNRFPKPTKLINRFARSPSSPSKKACVNYQPVCKHSRNFGNVYENQCSYKSSISYNRGFKKQAEKCVKLRKENRQCRLKTGLKATPKHDYAIKKIQWNVDDCGNIIYNQTRPISKRFRKSPPKSTRSIRPRSIRPPAQKKTPLKRAKSTPSFLDRAVKK